MNNKLARMKPEWIIVGLGNPGKKYEITRHNAGFLSVDYIADKASIDFTVKEFDAEIGYGKIGGVNCVLMKPQTFMNLSGKAVNPCAKAFGIEPQNVLVICDDINFEVGKMRIRKNGSSGGQNGMNSIIAEMKSKEFPRIKVGIGNIPEKWVLSDWVLSRFREDDMKPLNEAIAKVYDAVEMIVNGDIEKAMGRFN